MTVREYLLSDRNLTRIATIKRGKQFFYIVGSGETRTDAKKFNRCLKIFRYFAQHISKPVFDSMCTFYMFYVPGETNSKDDIMAFEEDIATRFNMYVMTQHWHIQETFTGKFEIPSDFRLVSSTWRPDNYCPCYEEVIHTITASIDQANCKRGNREFCLDGNVSDYLDFEISEGYYDISEQYEEEKKMGIEYDDLTAANEYLHQIWLIRSNNGFLTEKQEKVADLMSEYMPMKIPDTIFTEYEFANHEFDYIRGDEECGNCEKTLCFDGLPPRNNGNTCCFCPIEENTTEPEPTEPKAKPIESKAKPIESKAKLTEPKSNNWVLLLLAMCGIILMIMSLVL